MIINARPAGLGVHRRLPAHLDGVRRHWPLAVGLTVLAGPTLASLAQQSWTMEIGAHGPIVLATGLWLLVQTWPRRGVRTGSAAITAPFLLAALVLYAFGRAFDFISLEALGCWGAGVAVAWHLLGRGVRAIAFPLVYLALLVPPPGWLIDQATAPLQQFVSMVSTAVLEAAGYPIMRTGVVIFIAQYQLLVEQACSGMNSIVGLTAISLFYVYLLHRVSWRYALLLMAFILPIAICANIVRVTALVLITYHFGDSAAQGFLHKTTGIVLFGVGLALIVALDALFQRVLPASLTRAWA